MNKIIPSVVLIVLFSGIVFGLEVHPAFASGQFLQMPIRVLHGPTICAIEPQPNAKFPTVGKQLLEETEYAVIDWKTKLNQGLGRHAIWNINLVKVPIGEQNVFDYTKCDITINYLPEPEKNSNGFIAAGVTIPNFETSKTNIEIYYSDIQPNWVQVEWTKDSQRYYTYVNKPYYTGLVATSTQLDSTIRHEIGHSLGLGHYIVPYEQLRSIVNGLEDMPSIMIDTLTVLGVKHFDITPLDVSQIKSIYGEGGFDNQVKPQFGHQRSHQLTMNKQSYQPNEAITLNINTDGFAANSFAEILVIDSNNHLIENFGISKSNSTVSLSNKYQKDGNYWAELLDPNTGNYDFVRFIVGAQNLQISETPQISPGSQTIQIPTWVKNNAGLWAKGSMGDTDFINVMQYLAKQEIVKIPQSQSSYTHSTQIPKWIKNNAGWWADGIISSEDFIHGIQYLINNQVIKIK